MSSRDNRKFNWMVSYTARAAKALGYLKSRYNDIEIFVEDTSNHNMWLRVIQNIVPSNVKINSVNMIGGRNSVLTACRLDQNEDGRKKLYIIDGDFDFLLARPKPRLKHLYRIRGYCLENLLLRPESVLEVGVDALPMSTKEDIANLIDYPSILGNHEAKLTTLFVAYATAHKVAPRLKTTNYPVLKLTTQVDGCAVLNRSKIDRRIMQIVREAIRVVGVRAFSSVRREVQSTSSGLTIEQIVSGKDYLFPLVWIRLRRKCGYSGSKDQLKIQLAREFSPKYEPWFARRLLSMIN